MTSQVLANPRRTSLAALLKGTGPAACSGVEDAGCRNPSVRVVDTPLGSRPRCRSCADR